MEKIKKLKIKMQIVNVFTNVNGVEEYIDNRLKKICPQENISFEEVIHFFSLNIILAKRNNF